MWRRVCFKPIFKSKSLTSTAATLAVIFEPAFNISWYSLAQARAYGLGQHLEQHGAGNSRYPKAAAGQACHMQKQTTQQQMLQPGTREANNVAASVTS
jgi:hypothetical protein